MANEVTVGIDIGTTSVKALAADGDGRVVARARVPRRLRSGHAGELAHDARAAGGDPGADPSMSGELVRFLGWLASEHPDAAGYWPAQAVANRALCGQGAIDTTVAMTAVPLFDFHGWDEAVAAKAGVDHVGDVLVILGSTLIVWAVIPEWRQAPGVWTVPHTAPGKSLIGGPSNAGGLFVNWANRLLAPGDAPRADTQTADPGRVPVWQPYLRGERVPLHDPARRASPHDPHIGLDAADRYARYRELAG